jgi:hypothetical protein
MAAPVRRQMTRDEWNTRAVQLADEHRLNGTARSLATDADGLHLYQVPSRRHDGCYLVRVNPHTGALLCSCTAGRYGRACGHAGAAVHAERQRRSAGSEGDVAWSWWMAGGEWQR